MAFKPYMACTQINTYHSDRQEDKISDQQNSGIGNDIDITDSGQDHDNRYEAPKSKVTQNKPKSRSDEIRSRSRYMSCRPERLEINQ